MKDPSDQIHPIASPVAGDDKIHAVEVVGSRPGTRLRLFKCCCVVAAILLVTAAVAVTLIFSLFKLKGPTIRVQKLSVGKLDLANGANLTLSADVWVRNPNFAYFTYGIVTTKLFYRGSVVGEGNGPPGKARARRTTIVNVTVDIMTDRILSAPDFDSDLASGLVSMSSSTRVGGRMNAFVLIVKKFTVRMNCSMTLNITSRAILRHKCKRNIKVKL